VREPGRGTTWGGGGVEITDEGATPGAETGGPVSPQLGYRRVQLELDFKGSDWATIHLNLVQQLLSRGAKLTSHLVLVADSEAGLPQHFVDNQLPETLNYIDPAGTLERELNVVGCCSLPLVKGGRFPPSE